MGLWWVKGGSRFISGIHLGDDHDRHPCVVACGEYCKFDPDTTVNRNVLLAHEQVMILMSMDNLGVTQA